MVSRDTREVVVIKNINSNIIEEAIFILKSDCEKSNDKVSGDKQKLINGKDKDYILKEAQSVIDVYIRENKIKRKPLKRSSYGINFMSKRFSLNAIINISLGLSILALIYIVLKFI